MKAFYLGLQREQIGNTQDGSKEKTRGSGARVIQFEELWAKVTEGKKKVVATLIEYKIANRNLQDKLAQEELTLLAALRGNQQVELDVKQLRAEKTCLAQLRKRMS